MQQERRTGQGQELPAQTAAWGCRSRHEPRWPATVALIVALILYLELPDTLIYGPHILRWVVPALELALLLPLQYANPRRHDEESHARRLISLGLIGLVNLANVGSLSLLVEHLINGGQANGSSLIYSAILIWLTNVLVFGLWYWELDRGGPGARCAVRHREPDFLFPQMVTPQTARPDWTPSFVDYMYVSFTNASAFSPTDTMPLTHWAKGLMLIQSTASLLTIALVAARAVNILH